MGKTRQREQLPGFSVLDVIFNKFLTFVKK